MLTIINDSFNQGHLNFASVTYSTNETAPALMLTVTRTGGNAGEELIGFATSNLTAVAGVNYIATNGYLHWNSGTSGPQTIAIPLLRDYKVNIPDLQFYVSLFNTNVPGLGGNVAGSIGPRNQALCTINNADFYGRLQFSAPAYYVNENGGYATINVIRTDGSAEGVSARLTTSDGPYGTAGLNYLGLTTNLSFNPGEIRKTVTVPILDDGNVDPTTLFGFNVNLDTFQPTNASGYPNYPINAFVNIVDAETYNVPAGGMDPTFTPGVGFDDDVYSIALQSDGRIIAGGIFSTVGGQPAYRVARLLSNGVLDPSFTPSGGANSAVRAVVSQSDGRVVVGGDFTVVNGVFRNAIARLNYDGTLDAGFDPTSGANGQIYALAESYDQSGARIIYAGGLFDTYGPQARAGIVRLNNDATIDPAYNQGAGANGAVYAVAPYPTNSPWAGQVIIAGDFTTVNGIARNRIARLNIDGSLDLGFDPGAGATNAIRAVVIQSDGGIVIGGSFTWFGTNALNRIARLNPNGTVDTSFQVGVGANDTVYALAIQPDNRIVVVGQFTSASGVSRNRVTRLMPNGQVDPAINFGSGANNYIATVALQPDGKILIGGGFTQVQGQSAPHIARLYGGSMIGSGAFTFDALEYSVDETGTNAVITILRTGGTSGPNADGSGTNYVTFQTLANAADTTAVPGVNYSNVNVTLAFPAGETRQQVVVPVRPDQQVTPDLTVHLALLAPTLPATLGAQANALLTIRNVDSAVSFSTANYLIAENVFDGYATLPLERIGSTRAGSTVQFLTTTNGTAVPGVNYQPVTTNVLFQPGQTEQFVSIPIVWIKGLVEGNVTVDMILTNASGSLLLAPTEATLTIQDVDTAPGHLYFSQTNYVVGEGDGLATVYVWRTNGHTGPVSASYLTIPGDATPGHNYLTTTGVVNIADGDIAAQPIQIPIQQLALFEGNRTFSVLLTNATGGADIIGVNPVPVTIIDNHIAVSFATNSNLQATQSRDETNNQVLIDVYRLNAPTNLVTTVYYSTSNGTAVAGINYDPLINQPLTFQNGETHKTISIHPRYDPLVTGGLTLLVGLYNATPGVQIAQPSVFTLTLNDVDTGLSIAETNVPVVPNPTFYVMENSNYAVVTVMRTNANTGVVSVGYSTADGTAVAPFDYASSSGVLVFTNNQLSNSFAVPIVDNLLVDGNRYFSVNLFGATAPAQLLSPSNATVVIVDNDAGLGFSASSYEVTEGGNATITVQRTGSTNGTVLVNYSTTSGGTAKSTDYNATSGTLVFTNGVTTMSFNVQTIDNTTIEGDRTVLLALSSPQPNTSTLLVNPSAATLTIHDNDGNLVVAAGTRLLSEVSTNTDLTQTNVIHPGDVVTIMFAFRNAAGSSNVVSLNATLLATNGIVNPAAGMTTNGSPTTNYGPLALNGPVVARPFSFKAQGTNGQAIAATFYLSDSGRMVGSNGLAIFNLTLGARTVGFTNSGLIVINDATDAGLSVATPYPASLSVSNVAGVISRASITISNLNHWSPGDIEMLLGSPANQGVLLMTGAGGSYGVSRVNLTFDDATNNPSLPYDGQITNGTYQPTAYVTPQPFPTPAPQPPPPTGSPYTNKLAAFNGSNPVGTWGLYVMDVLPQNGGFISNGWSLKLTLVNPVGNNADLGLYLTGTPNPVIFTSNVVYTLTLTNWGPADATGIRVTNFLPVGTVFLTNSVTPASAMVFTNGQGALIWSNTTLQANAATSLSFAVSNTLSAGTLTNTAMVSADTVDLNPDDDSATVITTAISPSADLAINVVGAPDPVNLGQNLTYTITVTNLGPGTAPQVQVTNTLPTGVSFVSASPNCAFGTSLATVTQSSGSPYPTNVEGTTVTVTDALGVARLAPLSYVSPTQVNYIVPGSTALGQATVTVASGGTTSSAAAVIAAIDPGLFLFGGTDLVAAYVQRGNADGSQTVGLMTREGEHVADDELREAFPNVPKRQFLARLAFDLGTPDDGEDEGPDADEHVDEHLDGGGRVP